MKLTYRDIILEGTPKEVTQAYLLLLKGEEKHPNISPTYPIPTYPSPLITPNFPTEPNDWPPYPYVPTVIYTECNQSIDTTDYNTTQFTSYIN